MEREWRADAHQCYQAPSADDRREGVVDSTQAPEQRESAPKGKVHSDAKFPDRRSQRQRTKSGSETVDEQVEKKGRKNSALRNARVDPR